MNRKVLVFTRCPDPGRCKTRLIPALGAAGATELHEALVRRTVDCLSEVLDAGVRVEIHYTGESVARLREICEPLVSCVAFHPQCQGDLGDRLAAAFEAAFQDSPSQVLVMGTDCPGISPAIVIDAFVRLEQRDLVLGPATDGGYYLLALRRPAAELFRQVPWGGPDVLETTLIRAKGAGLSFQLLSPLDDVDRPEDLGLWRKSDLWLASPIDGSDR